jgi:hypothetical protein
MYVISINIYKFRYLYRYYFKEMSYHPKTYINEI